MEENRRHPIDGRYLKSKRETAHYLGISIGTLERLVHKGLLPFVRVGNLVKFRPEDLADFVDQQRIERQPGQQQSRRNITPRSSYGGPMKIGEFKPLEKNTLRGFIVLELSSGLIIRDCTLHEKSDSRWVSMPAKQYTKDGTTSWSPVVEFATPEARNKFKDQALEAIDRYLAGGGGE